MGRWQCGTKKGGRSSVTAKVIQEKVLTVPALEAVPSPWKQGHTITGLPRGEHERGTLEDSGWETGQKMQT